MNNSKTPWTVSKHYDNGDIVIRDARSSIIANLSVDFWRTDRADIDQAEIESNAFLMASSPSLCHVLIEEREALNTWLKAEGLPQDVRDGMHISLDKIRLALDRTRRKHIRGLMVKLCVKKAEAAGGAEAGIIREFVEDVKLAFGTGEGDEIDEGLMDWPDLAVTYRKATAFLDAKERAE
jgi:hypothetical protein